MIQKYESNKSQQVHWQQNIAHPMEIMPVPNRITCYTVSFLAYASSVVKNMFCVWSLLNLTPHYTILYNGRTIYVQLSPFTSYQVGPSTMQLVNTVRRTPGICKCLPLPSYHKGQRSPVFLHLKTFLLF